MRRIIRTFALLAPLLALSLGGADAQDRPIISVVLPPSTDVAPLLYADHAGLFTKAGLNVQITQLPNGATIAADSPSCSSRPEESTPPTIPTHICWSVAIRQSVLAAI
jgi:hypothetical protein